MGGDRRDRYGVINGGKPEKKGGLSSRGSDPVYWERIWTIQIIWFGILISIIGFALWGTAYLYTAGPSDVELGFNWQTGKIAGLATIAGGPLIFWVIFPAAYQKAWKEDPLLGWLFAFGVITLFIMVALGMIYTDFLF